MIPEEFNQTFPDLLFKRNMGKEKNNITNTPG